MTHGAVPKEEREKFGLPMGLFVYQWALKIVTTLWKI
jgi:hypothetical protein